MGYLKSFLVTTIMLLVVSFAYSQNSNENLNKVESNKTQIQSNPQAYNTVHTGGKPSEVTAKVIELAQGDDYTAEKVVRFIKVDRNPPVTQIVSDEKYLMYGDKIPEGIMSESEVIELINQFK